MTEIVRRHATLEIRSRLSAGSRFAFALLAPIPLLAPWELLITPRWTSFIHPVFFFALLISAGALAVSMLFVLAAVAGLNESMTFDASKRLVIHVSSAPLIPLRRSRHQFSSIRRIGLESHDNNDGETVYAIAVVMDDDRSVSSPASTERTLMEEALEQARLLVDGRTSAPSEGGRSLPPRE